MKKLLALTGCVLLCLLSIHVSAQNNLPPVNEPDYNKPRIFTDLPEKMSLRIFDAEQLFSLHANDPMSVQITNELFIKGSVLSAGEQHGVRTVLIKAANRNNAIFSFSRITKNDGSYSYTGRIMSRDHGDALQVAFEDNVYVLKKINLYDLISE